MATRTATLLTSTEAGEIAQRRWRFEVTQGADLGLAFELRCGTVLVGTHVDNDLCLSDSGVSRYHAELRLFAEGIDVHDLGSKNGTRVGDARVDRIFVPSGGRIRVGQTTIRVRAIDEPMEVEGIDELGAFVTCSEAMKKVLGELVLVAATDATVVLEGPTGTGKELLARSVHERSPRAAFPYVVVDCASIQANLIESQLFGHGKGAFTGADADRVGAFERANGGTVFLDEVGELPLELQPRLLRVLEARTIQRVGEDTPRDVDVRIVAATNRSLVKMVEARTFRADLYHRLAVVRLRVLPLVDRPEDVPVLAERIARDIDPAVEVRAEVKALLRAYDWPGNVRELRNVIERAVLLARGGPMRPEHVFPDESPAERYDEALQRFEQRYVASLLALHDGVVSKAADAAGLSRGGLYKVMKRAKATKP